MVKKEPRYARMVTGSSRNAKNRKKEWKMAADMQAAISPDAMRLHKVTRVL